MEYLKKVRTGPADRGPAIYTGVPPLAEGLLVKIENKEAAIENCVKRVKGWIKKWREEESLLTGKVCNWLTPHNQI